MSDNDASDDDDDDFLYLFDRFPTPDDVLAKVRRHDTIKYFKLAAAKNTTPLMPDDIDKALDENFVPWHKFHDDIVQSFANSRGTTKAGAARGSVRHMDTKVALKKEFCNSRIEEFTTVDRKNAWRSVLQTFACLYIEELENNYEKEQYDLSTRIDNILASTWTPMDKIHEECIYMIAGAMMKAADDKIQQQRTTDTLRESLRELLRLQKITKDEAIKVNAPTGRVVRREAVSLTYCSPEFYSIICKYESVYHTLLNEDGIKMYGEGLLKQINSLLNRKDVGMKNLLGAWADDTDAREVSLYFINYYTNLRGKDYARKYNAKIITSSETHRAEVGLRYQLAKEKHESERLHVSQNDDDDGDDGNTVKEDFKSKTLPMLRKICGENGLIKGGKKAEVIKRIQKHMANLRMAEPAPADESLENAEGDAVEEGGDESFFDTMRYKQLKALCREYGLHVSGNKSTLLDRLRTHFDSLENENEASDSDEEDDDPNEEEEMIALYEESDLKK